MAGRVVVGLLASIACVVSALWLWQNAAMLAWNAGEPDKAAWAIGLSALALTAAAQWAISRLVLVSVYGREKVSDAYAFAAVVVFVTSLTGAALLAVAGR